MARFRYKISDAEGQVRTLTVEADNVTDAEIKLRENEFTALAFLGESGTERLWERWKRFDFSRKKFDVVEFTGKLAPLLESHVQLPRTLQIIHDGSTNAGEREVVAGLRRGLQEGKRFSTLLRASDGAFPPIYASLAEVGEETGELPRVVTQLHRFLHDGRETRDFLITSSIYPLILLCVTFLVLLAVFVFFLPYFANIFTDMGRELPGPTRTLLAISNAVLNYWWLWVMGVAGVWWYVRKCRRDPVKQVRLEALAFRIPVIGKLREAAEMSRFFRTLAILFQSHVQVLVSIRIGMNVLSSTLVRKSFDHLDAELRAGGKLSAALARSPYVSAEAVQMVAVGEESGEVGEMFEKVAERQEAALKLAVKRLLALFEPLVIVVLALVILVVVLSVFMTILEMNDF
ncbi:MAG: type II secretion system F family protein [Victivallaceae bacterium]|nr:type II secretion system F family protein [Victivallaceae bacterium]